MSGILPHIFGNQEQWRSSPGLSEFVEFVLVLNEPWNMPDAGTAAPQVSETWEFPAGGPPVNVVSEDWES